ncbi:hypothetical protein LV75_004495 [Actinokineospora diospyrosa]|uniref:Uncharacterized protein n=1 Tax=Actinokineospora diospyrosa TaxID=103728 RepID=A0ABT1IH57_9PSEU|nr:hypothetical protein [Actinokineospora diospyrosa]
MGGDSVQIGNNIGDVHVTTAVNRGRRASGSVVAATAVVVLTLSAAALVMLPLTRPAESQRFTILLDTSAPQPPDPADPVPSPVSQPSPVAQIDDDLVPCWDTGGASQAGAQSDCDPKSARQKRKGDPKSGQSDRRCLPR